MNGFLVGIGGWFGFVSSEMSKNRKLKLPLVNDLRLRVSSEVGLLATGIEFQLKFLLLILCPPMND